MRKRSPRHRLIDKLAARWVARRAASVSAKGIDLGTVAAYTERNKALTKMLKQGLSWNAIIGATCASRSTLARLRKRQHGS
jgi:hypothetical protein